MVEGGRKKSRSRKALRDFAVYPSKMQRKRREVLQEWHGVKEPPSATKNLKALQELVPDLMGSLGLEERCAAEEMNRIWRELVGDFNASLSRPARIQRGVLFVQVMQPAALYDFERTLKVELLKKIQERMGADRVREIRFTA